MTIPDAKAAVEDGWKKLETIQAWKLDKVKSKKEVILEAQWNKSEVHLASLMDLCHLKSAELEPKFQKYKGQVVLRGDIVKDHSGAYAVFTQQGSSASQMTEAKVMDYNGQAADAISAHTQVKMEDAPKLFRIPKSECPDIWIRIPRHWFLLNETCTDTHLRDYHGKRRFEKILWELAWGRIPNWECLFLHRKQCLLQSMYVDDIKMAGKKQNMAPMLKKVMKNVVLDEPTSLLDHVYLGCTQREFKPNEDIVKKRKDRFVSRISAGAT